jgi:spore coat protein U-like protein
MMKKISKAVLAASFGLMSVHAGVMAAQATSELTVTANVNASCSINTNPVSFGSYNPANAQPTYVSGSVTVACVKGSVPVISLSGGLNPGANPGERAMKHTVGTDLLSYFLYKPASVVANTACTTTETNPWGSVGTERFEPGTSTGIAASTYNICGKIPAAQDVSTGSYQDTVTATVEF